MGKSLREMLIEYRSSRNLKQSAVAQELGVTSAIYSAWERGHNVPGATNYRPIADLLGLTVNDVAALADEAKEARKLRKKHIVPVDLFMRFMNVPVLGTARAGIPSEDMPENMGVVADFIGTMPPDCFAVRVKGDSMESDRKCIPAGSLCVCQSADGMSPSSLIGKVVCIRLEGEEHLIKELDRDKNVYFLKSWNQRYLNIPITNEDAQIEGVVLFVLQRISW